MTGTLEPSAPADLETAGPERAPRPRPARRRVRLRLWVVGAVLVGALVFVLFEGLGSSLNYFDTVDQALAHKASLGTTTFRLEGLVVPGTIRATAVGADFTVSEGGKGVPVRNTGTPPQLFGPNIPVVIVGHFDAAGSDTFISNQVLVKHSANYIAGHPGRVTAPNGSVR